jgi:hypothetical protein
MLLLPSLYEIDFVEVDEASPSWSLGDNDTIFAFSKA